jgi:hypothetical protein
MPQPPPAEIIEGQHLMAILSTDQMNEVKRLIIQSLGRYQREDRITFPIAVRMVAARKPV